MTKLGISAPILRWTAVTTMPSLPPAPATTMPSLDVYRDGIQDRCIQTIGIHLVRELVDEMRYERAEEEPPRAAEGATGTASPGFSTSASPSIRSAAARSRGRALATSAGDTRETRRR